MLSKTNFRECCCRESAMRIPPYRRAGFRTAESFSLCWSCKQRNYNINWKRLQQILQCKSVIFTKKISACAAKRKSVNPLLAGGNKQTNVDLSVIIQTLSIPPDFRPRIYFVDYRFHALRTPQTSDSVYQKYAEKARKPCDLSIISDNIFEIFL